jgi:hypothetical protein
MRTLGPIKDPGTAGRLTLRRAADGADAAALARLAALDSSPAPQGTVLLAEVGGDLWAAVSVDDLDVVADPFRPTGELVWLLLERARQVRAAGKDVRRRPRGVGRLRLLRAGGREVRSSGTMS